MGVEDGLGDHVGAAADAEERRLWVLRAGAVAPEAIAALVDDGRDLVLVEVIGTAVHVGYLEVDATRGSHDAVDDLIGW